VSLPFLSICPKDFFIQNSTLVGVDKSSFYCRFYFQAMTANQSSSSIVFFIVSSIKSLGVKTQIQSFLDFKKGWVDFERKPDVPFTASSSIFHRPLFPLRVPLSRYSIDEVKPKSEGGGQPLAVTSQRWAFILHWLTKLYWDGNWCN